MTSKEELTDSDEYYVRELTREELILAILIIILVLLIYIPLLVLL